ncbi:hypothetical protein D3C81_2260250 [compost metagenome]
MQCAVSGDFIVFHFLGGANQTRIADRPRFDGVDDFLRFFCQPFKGMAFHALDSNTFCAFYKLI